MKRISLFLSVALLSIIAMSCGSSKAVVNNTPASQPMALPCPECTEGDFFAYLGQAVAESDYDLQDARIFAAQAARDEIQAMIESVVTRSVDKFNQLPNKQFSLLMSSRENLKVLLLNAGEQHQAHQKPVLRMYGCAYSFL